MQAPTTKPTCAILPPHAAYNLYLQTSILLFDACAEQAFVEPPTDPLAAAIAATPPPYDNSHHETELPPLPDFVESKPTIPAKQIPYGAMPGSAWLDFALPLPEAASKARQYLLNEMTPDDTTQAMILYDDEQRARQLAALLISSGCACRRVRMVERAALQRVYPFLFFAGAQSLTLPNEIIPGRLYLGSAATANADATRLLRITHVVSLLDRSMPPPPEPVRHLLVRIADTCSADMDGALMQALPFIEAALCEPVGGRVLVHCEAGQSRSATVVIAALMANVAQITPAALGVDEALAVVAAQRPNVRPNDGFKACLRRAAWMTSAPDYF